MLNIVNVRSRQYSWQALHYLKELVRDYRKGGLNWSSACVVPCVQHAISFIVTNLAAIHNTRVSAGLHSHFYQQLSLHLHSFLKGIKKTQAIAQPPKKPSNKLPSTS